MPDSVGGANHPRLVLIGALPPPVGGITQHVSQLAKEAVRRGYQCKVIDTLGSRVVGTIPGVETEILAGLRVARGFSLARSLRQEPSAIRHFHISQGASFARISPFLWGQPSGRDVCTIHSGAIEEHYRSLLRVEQQLLRAAVRRMARVVALTPHITRFLINVIGLQPDRVVEATSFIGATVEPEALLEDPQLPGIRRQAGKLLVTSGYRQPLYRYEDFIAAVDGARTSQNAHGVIVAYGDTDEVYWRRILDLIEERPYIHVVGPLQHRVFLALLSAADLYVRCTESDSCGVGIYESLAAATPAIATDVCIRAPGTILVPVGRQKELDNAVETRLSAPSGDGAVLQLPTNSADILFDMYRDVAIRTN